MSPYIIIFMVEILEKATVRFELTNNGFADRSLTTWVRRRRRMVRVTGFEPVTPCLSSKYSNQLS